MTADGYRHYSEEITVEAGDATIVDITLEIGSAGSVNHMKASTYLVITTAAMLASIKHYFLW